MVTQVLPLVQSAMTYITHQYWPLAVALSQCV